MNAPHLLAQPRPEPRPSVWASIRLSSILELPESEYRRWIGVLESDPIYSRLRLWAGGPIVRREPRPGARFGWPSRAVEFPADADELWSVPSGPGLPALDEETVGAMQRLGLERFERAFLRGDDDAERAEAAAQAGLSQAQRESLCRLVDSLWLSESAAPPGVAVGSPASGLAARCVAALEREGGGYAVAYFSPHYLRGRYRVDYEGLERLRGAWPAADWRRARELIRQLELANQKLTALGRILEALPRLQPEFLGTGEPSDLAPLRQNAVARELGLSASAVCRALAGRSVRVPGGREVALGAFFPSTRERTARWIWQAAAELPGASDEAVRERVQRRWGLRVTRRLVNLRRREQA